MDKWAHEELGIPLNEAASFFMRIRTPRIDVVKTAGIFRRLAEKVERAGVERKANAAGAAIKKAVEEGKIGVSKGESVLSGHLSPEEIAKRKADIEAWLAGGLKKNAAVEKAEKTDEELKEEGRKRGVANLAAEAEREKGRRGARVGKSVGSIAGGVGGAALGRKYIGGPAGTIAGLAAGMVAGGRAGEELGTERDIKKNSPKFTPISKLGAEAPPPDPQAAIRARLVDEQMAQLQAVGFGDAPRETARINAFRLGHVNPREEQAQRAAHYAARGAGQHRTGVGAAIGAGLGLGVGGGLLRSPSAAAALGLGGALVGGGIGHASRLKAQEAAQTRALEAERQALGIHAHVDPLSNRHFTAYRDAPLPEEWKTAAANMRMQRALLKLADDGSMMAPAGEQDMGAMAPPPPQQELAPQNYLQAELMGQQAQEAQEQQFYRDQLKSQQQQTEQLNQQVQQMQQQLQQTQQQADQAQQQISQATQQAVAAQDQATQQAQAAAEARISAQRMRAQILDLVSKDPSMFALEQGQPGPGQGQPVDASGQPIPPEAQAPDAGMGAPAQEGPAAAAPAPQTAPGAAPPAGAPDMNAPAGPPPGPNPAGAEGTTGMGNIEGQPTKTSADWSFYEMLAAGAGRRPFDGALTGSAAGEGKVASVLPAIGAGLGALTGAAAPLLAARNTEALRQKVTDLEGAQDGSFRQALYLASARTALAGGQLAKEHPVVVATLGGLQGALGGAQSLPAAVHYGRSVAGKLSKFMG